MDESSPKLILGMEHEEPLRTRIGQFRLEYDARAGRLFIAEVDENAGRRIKFKHEVMLDREQVRDNPLARDMLEDFVRQLDVDQPTVE